MIGINAPIDTTSNIVPKKIVGEAVNGAIRKGARTPENTRPSSAMPAPSCAPPPPALSSARTCCSTAALSTRRWAEAKRDLRFLKPPAETIPGLAATENPASAGCLVERTSLHRRSNRLLDSVPDPRGNTVRKNHFRLFAVAAIAACCSALIVAEAKATAIRTFVSGHGTDTGTCGVGSPCRTFAYAITQTSAGGEIVVLDSAGYGSVTITQSVSITNIGNAASITATTGNAITISAATTDKVKIRGLGLYGLGSGATGILINSAKSVVIRTCYVTGFLGDGITYQPSGSAASSLNAIGISSEDNAGNGITIAPSAAAQVTAYLNDAHFEGNTIGVLIDGHNAPSAGIVNATVSVGAINNGTGIEATTSTGQARTIVMVTSSRASNNTTNGLSAVGGAVMYVDRVQASGNPLAWTTSSGGVIDSYKDNQMNGNVTDTTMPTISEE
jgi:hypothetical protein